jgi:hypothetical protein
MSAPIGQIQGFVHVGMPPYGASGFRTAPACDRVRSCIRPFVAALRWPRAGMAMRGSEAYQRTELGGSCTNTVFSDPDLIDPLPLLFSDLLSLPTCRDGLASAVRSDQCRHRVPVDFLLRQHCPEGTCHLVRQRDRGDHAKLAGQQAFQPTIVRDVEPLDRLQNGHRAGDQERSDVALAHLRGLAKPGLATA